MKVSNFFCLFFLFQICFVFGQQEQLNKYDVFLSEKDKAETLYINNQYKEAIIAFDKVVEKHVKSKFDVDIYFEKAECLFKLKKSVKAIDVLKESIKYGTTKDYFDNGY
jgi:tetratricopeptide (TPR) repeat protein